MREKKIHTKFSCVKNYRSVSKFKISIQANFFESAFWTKKNSKGGNKFEQFNGGESIVCVNKKVPLLRFCVFFLLQIFSIFKSLLIQVMFPMV